MLVQKFGGTSVQTLEKITRVANFIYKNLSVYKKIVVVVSAMGQTTNNLTNEICSIAENPPAREVDQLLSIGEIKSASLLATALIKLGAKAISLTGWQTGIFTDKNFGGAFIEDIDTSRILNYFKTYDILVVTGFQGVTINGDITTLGKGGSDTTAVALSASLSCGCEIYTDVEGIYTCDPKIFKDAKKLENISFAELMEASASGAKVMETRSVEIASKYQVGLYIAKSLEEKKEGTFVGVETKNFESMAIKNLVVQDSNYELKIEIQKEQNLSGLFEILATTRQKIQGAKIAENCFLCIIEEKNKKNIEKILKKHNFKYNFQNFGAKITLIGSGFQTHILALKNIFQALEDVGVKVTGLSITEISVTFLVDEKDKGNAIRALSQKLSL